MEQKILSEIQDYLKRNNLSAEEFLEDLKRIQEQEQKKKQWEKKKEQLLARKNRQLALQSERERKQRTRNLIQVGGAVYSVLGRSYEEGDIDRLIYFLNIQETHGHVFSQFMNKKGS